MNFPLWQIILLAIVQGITEFLPVSSSGHLVIVGALLAGDPEKFEIVDLSIVLHGGTLLSILVYYRRRVWQLFAEDRRVIGLLILGTLPAVVVGLPLKKYGGHILNDPLVAGAMLPVTGVVLLIAAWFGAGERSYQRLSWGRTLAIGISQALAILPGLSRSGVTISTGTMTGLTRSSAAAFSFLLAIPAIGGAMVLEAKDMLSASSGEAATTPWLHLLIGFTVSFAVGLVALHWLVKLIEVGRLHYFAYWCIPVGVAVVIWRLAA